MIWLTGLPPLPLLLGPPRNPDPHASPPTRSGGQCKWTATPNPKFSILIFSPSLSLLISYPFYYQLILYFHEHLTWQFPSNNFNPVEIFQKSVWKKIKGSPPRLLSHTLSSFSLCSCWQVGSGLGSDMCWPVLCRCLVKTTLLLGNIVRDWVDLSVT